MAYTVTLIPGDGTGPELVDATRRVLEATGLTFTWDVQDAGEGDGRKVVIYPRGWDLTQNSSSSAT